MCRDATQARGPGSCATRHIPATSGLRARQVLVRARLRRLACPQHGVRGGAIPFARARSGFTRDFEDLVAYLATKTDKTTITRLSRVDWDTIGRVCEQVVADGLDPTRLDGLVKIGVDEVSWRRNVLRDEGTGIVDISGTIPRAFVKRQLKLTLRSGTEVRVACRPCLATVNTSDRPETARQLPLVDMRPARWR
jgi:Helix-turn-helix domain of transposase family ISL3